MGKTQKRKAQEAPTATPALKKQHKEAKPATTTITTSKPLANRFIEEPKGAELKREVELYDLLSSQDEIERLEAADAVVSGLLGGDGVSEAVLTRHLERRLLRGLASGRKAARLGFSVVLTEVLGQLFGKRDLARTKYTELGFAKVLEILKAKTKPEGDLSGQEQRDHAFGLLFGLQCLVRAKILFVEGEDRWEPVFNDLIQLAKKKTWMREECGWVILEALRQMNQNEAEDTLKRLQNAGLAVSPEGVGIWLTARHLFPEVKFPNKPWGSTGNPLEDLSTLSKVMKESSNTTGKQSGEGAQQKGNWHPQLHFAWDIILVESIKRHESRAADFSEFWKVVVDESIFSASASTERKFWGFLIFQRVMKDVTNSVIIEKLFSPNFIRCLINHISHDDRFLHRAAERCIQSLLQATAKNPGFIPAIIPALIGNKGAYNFDQVTKTRTVERLLSQLEENRDYGLVVEQLTIPAIHIITEDSAKEAEMRRQAFGDYLLSMIRRANMADKTRGNTWIETHALPKLASFAYSRNEEVRPPISEKTRTVFKNRLNSAFAHLISDSKGFLYPCQLVQTLNTNGVDVDGEISAARDEAIAIVGKLLKRSQKIIEGKRRSLEAFTMLNAMVIFQLLNGESDALTLLNELKLCYKKIISEEHNEDLEGETSVTLLEILLSVMSKQSVLFRKITQQVFAAFSDSFGEESLKILVDVLESSESLKGQQQLFDEDIDQLEQDDSSIQLDSDVEILEADENNEQNGTHNAKADVSEDDDNEDEDDEEEMEYDTAAQELDDALSKALGTHRADQDLEEDSSDSDANMTDSEMIELDSKLVEIFSQRKKQPNKKKEKKDARENIINFKSRVLDLLEIYVKNRAESPQAFSLLVPLLRLVRTTTAKQLSDKAHNVIATFAKVSKAIRAGENTEALDRAQRLQTLKDIHDEASKDQSHAFAKAASTASLLVATSLFRAKKSNRKKIAKIYHDTEDNWADQKVKMQASFFHDWVNWCQSHVG